MACPYTDAMTAKELLRERIETLSEEEALDVLEFLDAEDGDEEFTDEDVKDVLEARREFARGDFMTLDAFKANYGL
jgi:hypothetical protein